MRGHLGLVAGKGSNEAWGGGSPWLLPLSGPHPGSALTLGPGPAEPPVPARKCPLPGPRPRSLTTASPPRTDHRSRFQPRPVHSRTSPSVHTPRKQLTPRQGRATLRDPGR